MIVDEFFSIQSTVLVSKSWFMEWFILIISVSIFSSDDVSMGIVLSFP